MVRWSSQYGIQTDQISTLQNDWQFFSIIHGGCQVGKVAVKAGSQVLDCEDAESELIRLMESIFR